MNAPTLALLTRGLRLDSRSLAPYIWRSLLIGGITLALMSAAQEMARIGAAGLSFLEFVVYFTFIFLSLTATTSFASLLTQEKEENTLGLLKMAGLSPLAILLGKAGSSGVGAVILLMSQFPFTFLAVTLGGVSVNQVFAIYVALLAYVVFLIGLGLFCSAWCRRSSAAGALMFILLFGFFIVPPLGNVLVQGAISEGYLSAYGFFAGACTATFDGMTASSVITRLDAVLTSGFSGSVLGAQVVSDVLIGLCFFGLTWLTFERFTREEHEAAPGRVLVARRKGIFRIFSPGRTWRRALIWKDFYFMSGGRLMMIAKSLLCGGLVALFWYIMMKQSYGRRLDPVALGAVIIPFMLVLLFLDLMVQAARLLSEEVKWKTLPNIMMLPLTTRQIVRRKLAGVLLSEIPYVVVFIFGLALVSKDSWDIRWKDVSDIVLPLSIGMLGSVFFLYLVTFFSLLTRYGGIPLAFLTMFVLQTFAGIVIAIPMTIFGASAFTARLVMIIVCVVTLALTVLVDWLLIRRVEKLAGE